MANEGDVQRLLGGVKEWNEWRMKDATTHIGLYDADLRGAELVEANLSGIHLGEAKLNGANLTRATLAESNLMSVNFEGANLQDASLFQARLLGSKLANANLTGADLAFATLDGAKLVGAKIAGARFGRTLLANLDLSSVDGLAEARHSGPSTVGIDTLCRSRGLIPEVFLRGAGIPDSIIAYAKSLAGNSVEYDSLLHQLRVAKSRTGGAALCRLASDWRTLLVRARRSQDRAKVSRSNR